MPIFRANLELETGLGNQTLSPNSSFYSIFCIMASIYVIRGNLRQKVFIFTIYGGTCVKSVPALKTCQIYFRFQKAT